jgi:hypothetical protein
MKQLLTKLCYGSETNPNKVPFGILPGVIKGNSIANNSGWYNIIGEKIGSGDLCMKDLETIAKHIPASEVFLILSEYDAAFNMPSHLDRHEPGKDYVISKAVWVVCKDTLGGVILRVGDRNDKSEEDEKGGVKYMKVSRKEFKKSIAGAQPSSSLEAKKKSTSSVPSEEEIIKEQLYKLYMAQKQTNAQQVNASSPHYTSTKQLPSPPPPTLAKSTTGVKKAGTSKFLTPAIPGGTKQKSSANKKSSSLP